MKTCFIWSTRFWPMKTNITSLQNPRLRELRKLKERKYRERTGTFLIEGQRFLKEALRQQVEIDCVIVQDEILLEGLDLKSECEILIVPPDLMKDLAGTVTPQGILAQTRIPAPSSDAFEKTSGLWLYLDEIRDPGNLGTIIRTAHAFGLDGLILSKGCADPYQEKVLRSTMGSIFQVPLMLNQDTAWLNQRLTQGATLYLADFQDAVELPAVDPSGASIVVIGNEAHGVSDTIRALPHVTVRIPMPGGAESLNAAVAAALMMYDLKIR